MVERRRRPRSRCERPRRLDQHRGPRPIPTFGRLQRRKQFVARNTLSPAIVAADANNGHRLAGIDWCSQDSCRCACSASAAATTPTSSTASAWAAGLAVPGAPVNPYPAQVINLSLGGPAPVPPRYLSVFAAALAHGVTRAIVVAAGNDGARRRRQRLRRSCPQAIAVAATSKRRIARGLQQLTAPASRCLAPGGSTLSPRPTTRSYDPLRTPARRHPRTDSIDAAAGTSFSAPIVGGRDLLDAGRRAESHRRAGSFAADRDAPSGFPTGSTCNRAVRRRHRRCECSRARRDDRRPRRSTFRARGGATGGTESGWGVNFAHQGDQVFAHLVHLRHHRQGLVAVDARQPQLRARHLQRPHLRRSRAAVQQFRRDRPRAGRRSVGNGDADVHRRRQRQLSRYAVNRHRRRSSRSLATTFTPAPQPMLHLQLRPPPTSPPPPTTRTCGGSPTAPSPAGESMLAHQGNAMFATWYTYDGGTPLWLSALAPRVNEQRVYGTLLSERRGRRFDAYDGRPSMHTPRRNGHAHLRRRQSRDVRLHAPTAPGGCRS